MLADISRRVSAFFQSRQVRYLVIGGVAIIAAAGVVGWHFFGGRGDVLKADGGPVVTVMDFGRSFPLDPLPSGWKHQKFWTLTPMTMAFTVKDGMPSMRFETYDSGSMLFRHVDIDLAAYPMLAWRWYIELPIRRRAYARRRRSSRAAVPSVLDRPRRQARDGGHLGQSAETRRLQIHRRFPTLRCRRRRRPGRPMA